jgi:phosphoribosylamine--glycine ligase
LPGSPLNKLQEHALRILIIGSGGREHALAWKLAKSPLVTEIHIAPGNGGTALLEQNQANGVPRYFNVPIETHNIPALIEYIQKARIEFVVPGPEIPLVNGISDACSAIDIPCFGPDGFAAQLEGSKVFSKEIMRASGVPTADYAVFADYSEAEAYVKTKNQALVIKAEGLAAGKGVVVAASVEEALTALDDMLNKKTLGSAAARVLIEETLVGEEVSLLAFCDGERAVPLPSAQDHKRIFDLDRGPNTGGMGAYSPAPLLPAEKLNEVCELVITPILRTMKALGHPFIGVLYAGLMYTSRDSSGIKVLEYNVRFGDPECQPLMLRLKSDLFGIMKACVKGELDKITVDYSPESALCVVLSARGYPAADYSRNMPINGISAAENQGATIFHAGTRLREGKLFACGGRVLNITALGKTLSEAQQIAYAALKNIDMTNAHYRKDIGAKAINRSL